MQPETLVPITSTSVLLPLGGNIEPQHNRPVFKHNSFCYNNMYKIYRTIVTMHHVPCTMYHGHLELICRRQPYKLWVVYTICCAVDQPNQTKRHPITPHHTRSLSRHHPEDSPSLVTRLLGYPLPCPWLPTSSPALLLTHLHAPAHPTHPPATPGHPRSCSPTPPPW